MYVGVLGLGGVCEWEVRAQRCGYEWKIKSKVMSRLLIFVQFSPFCGLLHCDHDNISLAEISLPNWKEWLTTILCVDFHANQHIFVLCVYWWSEDAGYIQGEKSRGGFSQSG